MPLIKDQFFENHDEDISFFYTGRGNVIGLTYPDAVISNSRNAHYINIASVVFDNTLQYTEENIIDESFLLRIENSTLAQYAANSVKINIIGHAAGKRITKDKFKCIVTPEIEYMDIPEIIVTEEPYEVNGSMEYKVCLWLHTENVKRIYLTKINSHAKNSSPLNSEYIDSDYYFYLLHNSDMVYDVDTTNIKGNITSKQFATGISIYKPVDNRMNALEAIRYPDVQFGMINYDLSWVPESTGDLSKTYQKVPPVSVDYGTALSPSFLSVKTGETKAITVLENGLYLVQIISGLNTMSAVKDSDVELSLFKNNDIIQGSSLIYKIKADDGKTKYANPVGLAAPFVLVYLTDTDLLRVQFKFLSEAQNGVVNKGIKLQMLKLIQVP